MTKKDYELIANVINKTTNQVGDACPKNAFSEVLVENFVDELFEQNPRFDYQEFINACGRKE